MLTQREIEILRRGVYREAECLGCIFSGELYKCMVANSMMRGYWAYKYDPQLLAVGVPKEPCPKGITRADVVNSFG